MTGDASSVLIIGSDSLALMWDTSHKKIMQDLEPRATHFFNIIK